MATQPMENDDEGEVLDIMQDNEGDEQSEPEQSEDYARRLGWKPKEDFKGDPEQWRDWEDFLNEDLSSAPQLKAQVKLLKRRLDQADRKWQRAENVLEEAKGYYTRTEERAYERALKEIRAKQRAAVDNADGEAFDAAEDELKELTQDMKAGNKPDSPKVDPSVQKAFRKWEGENDWYGSDTSMTAVADAIAAKMGSYSDNDMEPGEYLEELTRRVKKEFPHKFQQALPKKRSAVEGVSGNRSQAGAETFDAMPADAKAQFKRFETMGIPVTKDSFAKDYWAEAKKEQRR